MKSSRSPSGRVKVSLAGAATSVCADALTLCEVAAIGRLTTKSAEPTIVAAKVIGRAISTSIAIEAGPFPSSAKTGVAMFRMRIIRQIEVGNDLVFISRKRIG